MPKLFTQCRAPQDPYISHKPMLFIFLKGLLLGLAIAIPVGPIGILCIRRTLAMGQRVGFISGLGAATADGFYGGIAGFGLTAVADFLTGQAFWLRIVGGMFLCYLGITTFLAKPTASLSNVALNSADSADSTDFTETETGSSGKIASTTRPLPRSLIAAYTSALALTLTNPATIFSFAAIFAGLDVVKSDEAYATSGVLVTGVFFGSAFWWLFLSATVNLFRSWLNAAGMRWLNRISGTVILAFGMVALAIWE